MVISLWIGMIYLNQWSRQVMAILGGIGFGFFIDELGKFITSDNNYFFKPAAGLIYLIFIIMFLIIRELSRRQTLNPGAALANALSLLPVAATHDLHQEDARKAAGLLDMADQSDPMTGLARQMFERAEITPSKTPSRFQRASRRLHQWARSLTRRRHFPQIVTLVVLIWAISTLCSAAAIDIGDFDDGIGPFPDTGAIGSLESFSALVSVILVAIGAWKMRRGRRGPAYRYFIRALLVSILVTRVFIFVESQFAAVIGLAVDVLLLLAITELAQQEGERKTHFGGLGEPDLAAAAVSQKP